MDDFVAEILDFWLVEAGAARWYAADAAFDDEVRMRWSNPWRRARMGAFDSWILSADSALALLILLDQFPRNMFRGTAEAFSTDSKARGFATRAIAQQLDQKIAEPQRQFFYLPLMHSELPADQDRCVRLFLLRMPQTGADNLRHARAHREVIRRFGRFPLRNKALGRETSAEEAAWIADNGYAAILRDLAA